jgi:hypothetical protein
MGVGVAGVANYTNTSSGTATGVIAYGGVGGPYEYVSFFSVLNWFAKGEQGAWYDPSDFLPNWRRNLLLRSNDFLAWSFSNTTLTTGVDDAFGGALATTVSATANNGLIFTSFASVGYSAQTIYIRRKTGGGLIYIRNATNNLVDVTTSVTSTWSRLNVPSVSISGTAYFGVNISVSGDAVDICFGQCETGSTPSTYQKITDGIQDYYTYQPQPVLFQDSAGTIPVTALEQPVGLMLDKSKGLALGAELVTNGDFSNGTTGWTLQAGSVISGGVCTFSSAPVGSGPYQTSSTTISAGKFYQVTLVIDTITSGSFRARIGGTSSAPITSTGTITLKIGTIASDPFIQIQTGEAGTSGVVRSLSVRQIAGNHAFQPTSANRPILSSRVNLLTKTEDFSATDWVKATVTATPTTITATGTIAYLYKDNGSNLPIASYTLRCKVKAGTNNYAALNIQGTVSYWATIVFNVSTLSPSVGQSATGLGVGITITNQSIVPDSDGFYIISAVVSCTTSVLRYFGVMLASAATGNTFNAPYGEISGNSVGAFINATNPDLRPTNSGALLPPYQRVNTASDYDSVGFPLYLKANGTSSAMSTNSIDFTATDKMTVVTGVRKLSDATRAIIGELSSSPTINPGSFVADCSGGSSDSYTFYLVTPTSNTNASTLGYSAPISNVLSGQMLIIPGSINLRVNGLDKQTTLTPTASGNFGNYPLYLFARAGTSSHLNGQFYGAVIRGAQSDTASVTQTEQYMATKTGITF